MTTQTYLLPGGGPWAILPDCTAPEHNTQKAARGRYNNVPGGVKCICPHAKMLYERYRGSEVGKADAAAERALRSKLNIESTRSSQGHAAYAMKRAAFEAAWPLHMIGGYPWRVLPECKAPVHNVRNSWRNKHDGVAPCICPHAKACHDKELEAARAQRAAKAAGEWVPKSVGQRGIPEYVSNIIGTMPNLPLAACRRGDGPAIMLAAIEASDTHTLKLARAVDFCVSRCRNFMKCRSAVLRLESPAGSWAGVYGGLTPQDRREIAAEKGSVKS